MDKVPLGNMWNLFFCVSWDTSSPDETLVQRMVGRGFPTASQGRKASELIGIVKLAAFPPMILGFSSTVLGSESWGRSLGVGL